MLCVLNAPHKWAGHYSLCSNTPAMYHHVLCMYYCAHTSLVWVGGPCTAPCFHNISATKRQLCNIFSTNCPTSSYREITRSRTMLLPVIMLQNIVEVMVNVSLTFYITQTFFQLCGFHSYVLLKYASITTHYSMYYDVIWESEDVLWSLFFPCIYHLCDHIISEVVQPRLVELQLLHLYMICPGTWPKALRCFRLSTNCIDPCIKFTTPGCNL